MFDQKNDTAVQTGKASSKWTSEQVRDGAKVIAEMAATGQLDKLSKIENINKLAKESHWTKSDELSAVRQIVEDFIISLQEKSVEPSRDPIGDREAGEKLAIEPDIFKCFFDDMAALGFPAQPHIHNSILVALTMRLLPTSSATIFYGASSSGKSALFLTGAGLLPADTFLNYTSLSQQAAYYLGDIKHKVVALGEMKPAITGEDDPRQMALRQLVSENKLVKVLPERTGNGPMELAQRETEGPCSLVVTTTCSQQDFNDEWNNRCYWVPSDDSEETTGKALDAQAAKASSPWTSDKELSQAIHDKWRAFNSTLEPLPVVIPFAEKIKPKSLDVTVRRLFPLLLNYVRASALLHQKTRERLRRDGLDYVVAEKADYRIAVNLLNINAPRTIEVCGGKAREMFNKFKQRVTGLDFRISDVVTALKVPKATAHRYVRQWIDAGIASEVASGRGRSSLYKLEQADATQQDIGLIPYKEVDFDTVSVSHSVSTLSETPQSVA